MSTDNIQKALHAASDTDEFVLGSGVRKKTPVVFQQYFPGATAMVVADDITFEVAGEFVHQQLQSANVPVHDPFVFPGRPVLHADYKHIEKLRDFLQSTDVSPIAVGSGTINDIVKRASYEAERRYMVVATAASVDGYSSYGAAIQREGFKKTLECPAPLVIIADSDILRAAPAEMTAAGYADLVSKITAGADWIIADTLGVRLLEPPIWDMVQPSLRKWIGAPEKLKAGDTQAFEFLFEGLTMSGFAMQAMHDSRPASGSDHLFSHIWEMQNLQDPKGLTISHGFKVSIGTLASTALMETVFSKDIAQLDVDAVCEGWRRWEEREAQIQAAFGDTPIIDRVLNESNAKYITPEQLRERLQLLISRWEELTQKVLNQIIPYPKLREMLLAADCPVKPEQINLSRERVRDTFFKAQMIRQRYTILDLAYELGWLEECVTTIMASESYLRSP